MKRGMYSSDEIYDELANSFLHRSMVDAMYFEIKKLREENQQLKKQKDDVVKLIYKKMRDVNIYGTQTFDLNEILRMLGEKDDNKGNDE